MPFLVAEDKIIDVHNDKSHICHLLCCIVNNTVYSGDAKICLTDDIQIIGDQLHSLIDIEPRCVNTQIVVLDLAPFLT